MSHWEDCRYCEGKGGHWEGNVYIVCKHCNGSGKQR